MKSNQDLSFKSLKKQNIKQSLQQKVLSTIKNGILVLFYIEEQENHFLLVQLFLLLIQFLQNHGILVTLLGQSPKYLPLSFIFDAAEYSRISPFLSNFDSTLSKTFMIFCFIIDITMLLYSIKLIYKKYDQHNQNLTYPYFIRFYCLVYYYIYFQFKCDMIGSGFFCVMNPQLSYEHRCSKSIFTKTTNSIDFQIAIFASLIILIANTIIAGIVNSRFLMTDKNALKEEFSYKVYMIYLVQFFYFQMNFFYQVRDIIFITAVCISMFYVLYYLAGYGPKEPNLRCFYGTFHMVSILTNILISISYFSNNYLNEDLHLDLICIMTLFIYIGNKIFVTRVAENSMNIRLDGSHAKNSTKIAHMLLQLGMITKNSRNDSKDFIMLIGKLRVHLSDCRTPSCLCHTDFQKYIFQINNSSNENTSLNMSAKAQDTINKFIEQLFKQLMQNSKNNSQMEQEEIISCFTQFLFFISGKLIQQVLKNMIYLIKVNVKLFQLLILTKSYLYKSLFEMKNKVKKYSTEFLFNRKKNNISHDIEVSHLLIQEIFKQYLHARITPFLVIKYS